MVKIGFFASSKNEMKDKYNDDVNNLLNGINNLNIDITAVYGGGSNGIMGLVYEKFKGKIESHNLEKWKEFPNETIHSNMFDRQRGILENSDLFIVLPGGVGTVSEMFDCIMLNDTSSFSKPVIIFNCKDYYTDLFNYIDKLVSEGASKKQGNLYISSDVITICNIIHHHHLSY